MTTYSIINIVIIVSILAILLMTLSAILYNRSQVALDFIGQPVGLCNECSHLAQAMLLKARSFAIAGAVMGAASAAVWFGRERLSTGKILEATEWLRLRFPDYPWTGFTLRIAGLTFQVGDLVPDLFLKMRKQRVIDVTCLVLSLQFTLPCHFIQRAGIKCVICPPYRFCPGFTRNEYRWTLKNGLGSGVLLASFYSQEK